MTLPALPLFHSIAGQPVVVLGSGEAAAAKRRLVERAGGIVVSEAVTARLAFVAPAPDEFAPEAVVARLRVQGLLVNCADRPDLCDFLTPAILDRTPLLLAIGTGGASAGLAKAVRLRLEQLLPQRLGALASALAAARAAVRLRWPDAGERRRALDTALSEGGLLDPLVEGADGRVAAWLADGTATPAERIEIVLGSDDPEDLTLRQARLLGSADLVIHDAAVAPAILARARADAMRVVREPSAEPPSANRLTLILRRSPQR